MITKSTKITGVVLAGGLARRMHQQDKGLCPYQQQPMIDYALKAMNPVVNQLLINANRNIETYQQWGYEVIKDRNDDFQGPLAGVLTAMMRCPEDILLVMPCDSPLISSEHLTRLLGSLLNSEAEICVAFDGKRLHPVFLALKPNLTQSLEIFLNSGQRRIDVWLAQHQLLKVDYSDCPQVFLNINTLEELQQLENSKPIMTDAGLSVSTPMTAIDEKGETRQIELVGERALTIYVDRQEIVTLMTIGSHPEMLTLGYLKNQGFFQQLHEIKQLQVDWNVEAVAVVTREGHSDFSEQLKHRTVTTGCGQGTVFGRLMDKLKKIQIKAYQIKQSQLYHLLDALHEHNKVYKKAGAVHGCALCSPDGEIDFFVEDVGRHNAVDAIAGYMWLKHLSGTNKVFYTTGRLTSEMVIKITQMGIPILLSRSGATQMGLAMAQQAGVTLISRAKGKHFLVLNGADNVVFDEL